MSHWSTTQTQFKNLATLQSAAKELGLQWTNETSTTMGYRTFTGAIGVLTNGSTVNIPVTRDNNGNLLLHADWYRGATAAIVGQGFSKLRQMYGVHAVEMKARQRGLTVQRSTVGNKINITLGGMR